MIKNEIHFESQNKKCNEWPRLDVGEDTLHYVVPRSARANGWRPKRARSDAASFVDYFQMTLFYCATSE